MLNEVEELAAMQSSGFNVLLNAYKTAIFMNKGTARLDLIVSDRKGTKFVKKTGDKKIEAKQTFKRMVYSDYTFKPRTKYGYSWYIDPKLWKKQAMAQSNTCDANLEIAQSQFKMKLAELTQQMERSRNAKLNS